MPRQAIERPLSHPAGRRRNHGAGAVHAADSPGGRRRRGRPAADERVRRPRKDFIVDANGNGAGWFDYDNDGDLDALIVNGSTRQQFARGGDPMVALYQNDGRGRFRDVTEAAKLVRRGWGAGTCIADYDNDGFRDVYVTAFGTDALWRNAGDGTFVDVTRRAGVEDSRWSTGCAFGDYDLDGDLDLYAAAYVKFDESRIPGRGTTGACRFMATDVFCGPNRLPGEPDLLYRNNGDGTFTDVTARAGIVDPGYYGFGVVFTTSTTTAAPTSTSPTTRCRISSSATRATAPSSRRGCWRAWR